MAKRIKLLMLICLICTIIGVSAFATESPKNIEIIRLNFLENGNGVLGVYYGYPISADAPPIEGQMLYQGNISLATSELTINDVRYATICGFIEYTDTTDLTEKITSIPSIDVMEYKTILFHFYVLLDSVAKNLNFTNIEPGTVSLTIDTSSFVNQKYYMTRLDDAVCEALPNVDITTMREVDTRAYLIVADNISVSNCEQFSIQELEGAYMEYSCTLNNQKLSLTLTLTEPVSTPVEPSKLEQFLNSKYYNWFIICSCTFIVLAIIAMIIVAKSYTTVIEKEEKRIFEERLRTHDKDEPQLYWTQAEREAEKKKKEMMQHPNALIRNSEENADRVESVENIQHKRQSNFNQ